LIVLILATSNPLRVLSLVGPDAASTHTKLPLEVNLCIVSEPSVVFVPPVQVPKSAVAYLIITTPEPPLPPYVVDVLLLPPPPCPPFPVLSPPPEPLATLSCPPFPPAA